MNLLIPYVHGLRHQDPVLEEFTYGEGARAHQLRSGVKKGDYVFFHTGVNSRKYLTAYYVVDRVLDTADAVADTSIAAKYKTPHIKEYQAGYRREGDVILFGDPILSRKLERPLPFDRSLAEKLSLDVKFKDGFTDAQCIGSATRAWRKLSDWQVKVLLRAIKENEDARLASRMLSTEEVSEILERDLESFLEANTPILGKGLQLTGRQIDTQAGRIDLMFEGVDGEVVIVELKLGKIGHGAISQLRRYMDHVATETGKRVRGLIVCDGVLPAFREQFKTLRDIRILRYGWSLQVLEYY